jgi:hypothetical protein
LVLVDGGLQSVVGDVSRVGADFGTGRHNIGKLLSVVEENREEFSLQALERRLSKKLTSAEVAKYLKQVHEVSEANVDELKREVDKWRGVYQQDYKDIRDKVFAHRVMSSLDEMNVLFAKTKVEELKRLLHFLNSLYLALFAAHTNGVAVKLDSYDPQWFIGEQVRLEGERVLKWMVEEARGWPQRAVSESHFIITDKVSLCTLSRYRCPATGSAKKPTTR